MQERKRSLGPTGETVRANVRRLREAQNLSYAEVSRRLTGLGRPVATLGLSRIEAGERRVDADDLVALALVFEVSPASLLLTATTASEDVVQVTGAGGVAADAAWGWLTVSRPLRYSTQAPGVEDFHFQVRAKPIWELPHRMASARMTAQDHRDYADVLDGDPRVDGDR